MGFQKYLILSNIWIPGIPHMVAENDLTIIVRTTLNCSSAKPFLYQGHEYSSASSRMRCPTKLRYILYLGQPKVDKVLEGKPDTFGFIFLSKFY